MKMEMKYVIVDHIFPIIFTDAHNHKQFQYIGKVTSAGFFRIVSEGTVERVETYGCSQSLNMVPNEHDKNVISNFLFKKGEHDF